MWAWRCFTRVWRWHAAREEGNFERLAGLADRRGGGAGRLFSQKPRKDDVFETPDRACVMLDLRAQDRPLKRRKQIGGQFVRILDRSQFAHGDRGVQTVLQ